MAEYQTNLFINNEYVPSSTGETFEVYNPTDDSLVTSAVQVASDKDVDSAVAAAKSAFKTWRKTTSSQRAEMMIRFADLLEKHIDEIVKLDTICMGAPVHLAKWLVARHASDFRYYAGMIDKIAGETYPENGDGYFKMVNYEPMGVVAGIAAWNATQLFVGWKIAPAVAAGNTVVFKSSEKSPLSVLYQGALFKEAGFPPGVINLLSGAANTGSRMASHMDIARISFTGSLNTGRQIQIAAAKSNLKLVTLELGGKSASVVFNDAHIDNAVKHNCQGFLANSAQACAAGSRILVQEDIATEFIEKLKTAYIQITSSVGDPALASTFMGPVVDKAQFSRVMEYIDGAKKEGTEVLVGGGRQGAKGQFIQPTILLNPDRHSRVYTEEIFGPVVMVKTFKTEEEAIEMANDTVFGLSATLYTRDVTRAMRVSSQLEAGTVTVNSGPVALQQTPWGGWRQSGYGREGGIHGMMEYLQTKTVNINMNAPDN
ncbi:aldehyde dehydrogenase [Leptodontidium sp. 2 PMI_412]|nr:aldehyde dehydrogenase [Leptodontidium sp. 2 PMI_412]